MTQLVFWLFAVKYWIVAKKVELIRGELKLNEKTNLFRVLIFGGSAIVVILNSVAVIPEFKALSNFD